MDELKARIATALGWSERDVNNFSLATLREMVRPKHPKLATEISEMIARGDHILETATRPRRKPWRA